MPEPVIDVHLLVPDPTGSNRILVRDGGSTLPAIRPEILDGDTLVMAVARHLRTAWQLDPVILETYLTPSDDADARPALAVLDPPVPRWEPRGGQAWAGAPEVLPPALGGRVRTWLAEWHTAAAPGVLRARWSRPGWQARAVAWIDAELAVAERTRAAAVEVRRLWSISALMRVPTDRGAAWFKAVFPSFGHEPAITELLANAVPTVLPRVLATHAEEEWLLLDEVTGPQLGMSRDASAITAAVRALVDVQRRSIDLRSELIALGAPHRPLAILSDELVRAMADSPDLGGPRVEPNRLADVAAWVRRRAAWLDGLGFPETVVHGDFNRANALVAPVGPVIIDWSDAAIGHPLLDMTAWMVHPGGGFGANDPSWPAWLKALDGLGDVNGLRNEIDSVFGLGAAYQVVSYAAILRAVEPAIRYQVSGGLADFWELLEERAAST